MISIFALAFYPGASMWVVKLLLLVRLVLLQKVRLSIRPLRLLEGEEELHRQQPVSDYVGPKLQSDAFRSYRVGERDHHTRQSGTVLQLGVFGEENLVLLPEPAVQGCRSLAN